MHLNLTYYHLELDLGIYKVSLFESIPVTDFHKLGTDKPQLIKQIIGAAREFDFFSFLKTKQASILKMLRKRSGNYSVDVGKLGLCLLDLICEGLGLQTRFFEDPSLTLGLPKHSDINLITLLQEQVHGLQVLKDDQWMAIEPVPNGFVVNIGHMLQRNAREIKILN
ncbi:unnamed protein product [Malus baccata var. baccata]